MTRIAIVATSFFMCFASTLAAKPALRDVPEIDNALFTVGLAHEIRKECPTIEPRIFRAYSFLTNLKRQALDLGYTQDEIDAHMDSDVEKDRLRKLAAEYMAARGFEQTEEGYCAFGESEIAQKSGVGALLRSTK